jgi:hypothetical protein
MLEQRFSGETYDHEKDGQRLAAQLYKVKNLMKDGNWRSLFEISAEVQAPEASVSARLRDLRKPRFGSHTVERKRVGKGLFMYRLILED